MAMANHLIHQANENSPFGDLTKEEFYKKHHVIHKESFMLNNRNMKIFTQSWCCCNITSDHRLKGLVAMIHGYKSESSWIFQLTAVTLAKAGFYVCALDLQGHGYSEGLPGHIPDIKPVVEDCIDFFDSARADVNRDDLPAFLYGESLGGALAAMVALEQKDKWSGLIMNGAMCGISAKMKPAWPLEKLLPVAAFLAPTWRLVVVKPLAGRSYKEEWKRRLVGRSPNRHRSCSIKPAAATALELLRVSEEIRSRCGDLGLPLLMVHGGDDTVVDVKSVKVVYELAGCSDKTLRVFPGMWHLLVGEDEEGVELVFGTILSWLLQRVGGEFVPHNKKY